VPERQTIVLTRKLHLSGNSLCLKPGGDLDLGRRPDQCRGRTAASALATSSSKAVASRSGPSTSSGTPAATTFSRSDGVPPCVSPLASHFAKQQ
jgi:hypothetical protein